MKLKTYKDYQKFLRAHSEPVTELYGIHRVTKPIYGFKKVRTYSSTMGGSLKYNPHSHCEDLERVFKKHYYSESGITHPLLRNKEPAIFNIIVPKGSLIHAGIPKQEGEIIAKFRANLIDSHTIIRISDEQQVAYGISGWDNGHVYLNGPMIGDAIYGSPSEEFCLDNATYASGIHFYVDLELALTHHL